MIRLPDLKLKFATTTLTHWEEEEIGKWLRELLGCAGTW